MKESLTVMDVKKSLSSNDESNQNSKWWEKKIQSRVSKSSSSCSQQYTPISAISAIRVFALLFPQQSVNLMCAHRKRSVLTEGEREIIIDDN